MLLLQSILKSDFFYQNQRLMFKSGILLSLYTLINRDGLTYVVGIISY